MNIYEIDPRGGEQQEQQIPGERVISGMKRVGSNATALVIHPAHCSTESSVDCVNTPKDDGPIFWQ